MTIFVGIDDTDSRGTNKVGCPRNTTLTCRSITR